MELARGLVFSRSSSGFDFSFTDRAMSFRLDADRDGAWVVTAAGEVPRGRETVLFAWESVALPHASSAASPPRLWGWHTEGLGSDRLRKLVAELALPASPGRYLELGDGWQTSRDPSPFRSPARDWWDALGASFGPDATPVPASAVDPETESERARGDGSSRKRHERSGEGGEAGEAEPAAIVEIVNALEARGWDVGLWIAPLGASSKDVYRAEPRAFFSLERRDDGEVKRRPIPGGALGRYVVDPTSPAGQRYLERLAAAVVGAGPRILRLAGLGDAYALYRRDEEQLADPAVGALGALRLAVRSLRRGAGDSIVLLGARGTPRELAPELESMRPWDESALALAPLAAESDLFRRWWPRVAGACGIEATPLAVRPEGREIGPPDRSAAQIAYALLTGRDTQIAVGRTLPDETLALLRQVPGFAVRPLDWFEREIAPNVWVFHGADRAASTVGLFAWDEHRVRRVRFNPEDLGLERRTPRETVLWYDLTARRLVGVGRGEQEFSLLPTEVRLLVAVAVEQNRPTVLSIAGRLFGREEDRLREDWDANRRELRLHVRLGLAGDSDRRATSIDLAVPPTLDVARVDVSDANVRVKPAAGGVARIEVDSERSELELAVTFTASASSAGAVLPRDVTVRPSAPGSAPLVEWRIDAAVWPTAPARFEVSRSGAVVGIVSGTRFIDSTATPGAVEEYAVRPVGDDRAPSIAKADPGEFAATEPLDLSAAIPSRTDERAGAPRRDRAATGRPLIVDGVSYARGWGVRSPSMLEFRLARHAERFTAHVGIDDSSRFRGRVEFIVEADGREVFRTGAIRGGVPAEAIDLDVRAVERLRLIVEDGGDGTDGDFANWCNPVVTHTAHRDEESPRPASE